MTFSEFLLGKRVAIVGPASSLKNQRLGDYINTFDVVCRFAQCVPIFEEEKKDFGSKTDVIMCNFWDWNHSYPDGTEAGECIDQKAHIEAFVDSGASWIDFLYPNEPHVVSELNGGRLSEAKMDGLYMDLNSLIPGPTKGICSIYQIHKSSAREIFVSGFTFNQKYGYCDSYLLNPFNWYHKRFFDGKTDKEQNDIIRGDRSHDLEKEFDFFKVLKRSDDRISCDPILEGLMK